MEVINPQPKVKTLGERVDDAMSTLTVNALVSDVTTVENAVTSIIKEEFKTIRLDRGFEEPKVTLETSDDMQVFIEGKDILEDMLDVSEGEHYLYKTKTNGDLTVVNVNGKIEEVA